MEVDEILEKLEGSKVRITYDSPYAVRAFIFGHLLQKFDTLCVIYTDTMRRRLERTYSSLEEEFKKINPDVICIGSDKTPFGKLIASIPLERTVKSVLSERLNVLNFRGGGAIKKSPSSVST